MKTKRLEQLVLTLAALLIIGYAIMYTAGASSKQSQLMNYIAGAGVAIFIGYSYIVQLRERGQIDGLRDKNEELKHKVADREHQIREQKENISSLNQQIEQLNIEIETERNKFAEADKEWKSKVKGLESQLAEAKKEA